MTDGETERNSRRRHVSRDGETSRGYVPLALEEVDAGISNAALGLLARLRSFSDHAEHDGRLDRLELRLVQVRHEIGRTAFRRCIEELKNAQLLADFEHGIEDLEFGRWCRTHQERTQQRSEWKARQDQNRKSSRVDTPPASREVSPDSSGSGNVSASFNGSGSKAVTPPLAEVSDDDAYQLFLDAWQEQKSRRATASEMSELLSWCQFLDRLTPQHIVDVMNALWVRESGQITSPVYYRSRIIELHQERQVDRTTASVPRGVGEPPEPPHDAPMADPRKVGDLLAGLGVKP